MSLPNQLTILRIILTPAVVILLFFEHDFLLRCLALLVFTIASLTDWYDGRMARKLGYVTPSGKFLDPLADKILVLSTLFAFAFYGHIAIWMVVVIAVRDVVITLLRWYAEKKRQPIVTSMTAKWKTASQMFAIYAILLYLLGQTFFENKIGPVWFLWLKDVNAINIMMQAVTLITVLTAVQYLFENRHHLRSLWLRLFAPRNLAK